MEAFAVSIACLQVPVKAALPCGVDAAALKPFRCASKEVLRPGAACGALAAMVVRHASYFLIYSSHSATPVFGSLASAFATSVFAGADVLTVDVVAVEAVFVVFETLAGLLAVVLDEFVDEPPQPNERTAKQRTAAIEIKLLIFMY